MDRFENMKTFIHIVDAGSMSAAADRLEVTKSAVSRRLKELEEHLGVQLFHRTTRSMNLTDSGTAFYQQAVRILEDVLEAENSITQAHGTLKGSLKIAVPYSFGIMHLGPAINEFLKIHPQIEFDLDFNDRQVDIVQEGFDLAIRIANLPDSSLIARRLSSIDHIACASPSYLEKHGVPDSPEDLVNHRCLAYNLLQDYKSWVFIDENKEIINVNIDPYFKSSAGESLREAAIDGHGICYLPTFIVYQQIEQQKLIPLLHKYKSSQVNTYAIYPQTRHLSQRVRVFVDFLIKRFEGTPYWDLCLIDK
ncbi:MAG: DNA-binding transcriptional LysR family regulator [Cocleimonas sp.]|jgi:DNA-binding transcriptional LysR family regulator